MTDIGQAIAQQPAAAVPGGYALVRCPNCRGTGDVCTGVIDGIPELCECERCAGTGVIPAPKSAAAGLHMGHGDLALL